MRISTFIIAATLALPFLTVAADNRQTLVVNGQSMSANATRIAFDGDNAIITLDDGSTLTSDMEAVALSFDWQTATGIEGLQVSSDDLQSSYDNTQMSAFDLQGRRVQRPSKGLYVIMKGDKAVKVVKR